MAKVTSMQGKAVGKVGSMVYSINSGVMIAREYNPNVANPNTQAQVDQRAKLKLMSQVAAAMAPVIAIPKVGLLTPRNQFIKKNFSGVIATAGVAQVTYENLQLTAGNAGLPAITMSRAAASGISIRLDEDSSAAASRVVYILYRKTSDGQLQYVQSQVVESAGAAGVFPATFNYLEGDVIAFAYGLKDLNAKASVKYSDYSVKNGEDVARLTLSRAISQSDYQFTKTRGTTLFAGESESVKVPDGQARVFVTAAGPGSVAGAGVFVIGSDVTVTATPNSGMVFVGWQVNGSSAIISRERAYTFTLQGSTDLVAVFRDASTPQEYYVEVTKGAGVASVEVTNNGTITAGQSCTLTATMEDGKEFGGWFDNTEGTPSLMSEENPYTFTPARDYSIIAKKVQGYDD